jgi:hypothetical protein
MNGKIRPSRLLQSPYIQIRAKVTMPGTTNGKPNIKEELKYVLPPSVKKIAKYITNQIFGSDLVTQTEGLDINWIMPSLSTALEEAIYDKEAFIYIHKFNGKVYLECLKKCDIHDLVQKYDQIISFKLYEDFEVKDENGRDITMSLERKVKINDDGTSTIEMKAYEKNEKDNEWNSISLERFNRITENEYSLIYNLPYEVLVNIDIGQEFFKDSEKLINEEMIVLNTMADEIEKTKTRIVTTQHYQSGDIVGSWNPSSNMYEVQTMNLGSLQDYFTLLPGDREHQVFEFLQGDIRVKEYVDTFKFYDYQIIQMANLSPATFGYEKDAYQNVASVDLNANTTEMTIEAIKKQIEPQINKLIENIIKLQQAIQTDINVIPIDLVWDYGSNERFDDMKKIKTLKLIQNTMAVPYSIRTKIIAPILNKLIDEEVVSDDLFKAYKEEEKDINITYEEI